MTAIAQRTKPVMITGESGMGKSHLIRHAIHNLPEGVRAVSICEPKVDDEICIPFDFRCVLKHIADAISLEESKSSSDQGACLSIDRLRPCLARFRESEHHLAVFVDDANDISEAVVADLLRLARPDSDETWLITVILAGSPQLKLRVGQPPLSDLCGNGPRFCTLGPLGLTEIGTYIEKCFGSVHGPSDELLSPEAIARIGAYSQGAPRLINTLFDAAVSTAKLHGKSRITREIVEEARNLCPPLGGTKTSHRQPPTLNEKAKPAVGTFDQPDETPDLRAHKALKLRELASERISIGRAEDSDIVLQNRGVPQHSATIEKNGESVVLIDNDNGSAGASGIFVNGERILRRTLKYWNEIQIFNYVLQFMALAKPPGAKERALDPSAKRPQQEVTVEVDTSTLGDLAKLRRQNIELKTVLAMMLLALGVGTILLREDLGIFQEVAVESALVPTAGVTVEKIAVQSGPEPTAAAHRTEPQPGGNPLEELPQAAVTVEPQGSRSPPNTGRKQPVNPGPESALAVQDSPVQTPGIASATKSSDKSAQAIDQWLQAADQALREYRLTTPRNENAYAYYRKVIELDPAHEQARAGITRIAERYVVLARRALNGKNRRLSRLYVRRGIDVQSDHSELLALRAELDESDRARVASRKPPPQHQRDVWDQRKGTGNIVEDFKHVWRSIFN